jgi:hypothetical protein
VKRYVEVLEGNHGIGKALEVIASSSERKLDDPHDVWLVVERNDAHSSCCRR